MFTTPRSSIDEIRESYPSVNLLESGRIKDWLTARSTQLYDRALTNSPWADWLKISSLTIGGLTAGLALSAPLTPPILLLCLTAYLGSIMEDREITRDVYLFPWVRIPAIELLKCLMSEPYRKEREFFSQNILIPDGNGGEVSFPVPEWRLKHNKLFTYLSLEDRAEATMLLDNVDARRNDCRLESVLAGCPGRFRFLLYRLILRDYLSYGNIDLSPQQIDRLYQELIDSAAPAPLPAMRLPLQSVVAPQPAVVTPQPVVNPQPVAVDPEPTVKPPPDFEIPEEILTPRPLSTVPSRPQSPKETFLDRILSSPFQSRAYFGRQRSGKTLFTAVASQMLMEKGMSVYHINLASLPNGDDDRYWKHATRSVRHDLPFCTPDRAQAAVNEAIDLVQEFIDAPAGSLLICDEWTIMGRETHPYAELIEPFARLVSGIGGTLVSSGTQRQKAIWTIAPDLVAGGLIKMARLAVKDLECTILAVAPGKTVTWQRADGQGLPNTVSFDYQLLGQLQNNYKGVTEPQVSGFLSGSDRIGFTNGKWYPVGELTLKETVVKPDVHYIPMEVDPLAQELEKYKNP